MFKGATTRVENEEVDEAPGSYDIREMRNVREALDMALTRAFENEHQGGQQAAARAAAVCASIMRVVSGVLLLGALEFGENRTDAGMTGQITSPRAEVEKVVEVRGRGCAVEDAPWCPRHCSRPTVALRSALDFPPVLPPRSCRCCFTSGAGHPVHGEGAAGRGAVLGHDAVHQGHDRPHDAQGDPQPRRPARGALPVRRPGQGNLPPALSVRCSLLFLFSFFCLSVRCSLLFCFRCFVFQCDVRFVLFSFFVFQCDVGGTLSARRFVFVLCRCVFL